jgi:hypothetical protein
VTTTSPAADLAPHADLVLDDVSRLSRVVEHGRLRVPRA